MNVPAQVKRAWWNLWIAAGAVVVFAALWIVSQKPAVAPAAFSILGLSGIPFFRRRQPFCDERDREIDRKAMLAAMNVFWVALVFGAVGSGLVLGWDTMVQVPVWAFSNVIWGGWLVMMTVKSVATIRMYRAG